jgi:predicted esterase
MSHIKWVFPDAPEQPVKCNGGVEMPSWFDLDAIPVTPDAWDDTTGLSSTVTQIHAMVDKLEREDSIPSERIMIGGFSQGGCASLLAALTCDRKLAGTVCFSGWLARSDEYPDLAQNKDTPIFWGHGDEDDKVLYSTACKGRDKLLDVMTTEDLLTFKMYPGEGHCSNSAEERDLCQWLTLHLPKKFALPDLEMPVESWSKQPAPAEKLAPVAAALRKEEGNVHFKAKRFDQAIASYTAAIELDSSNHVFFGNRSACYLALKDWEAAGSDAAESLKIDEDFLKGYARLATAQMSLGKPPSHAHRHVTPHVTPHLPISTMHCLGDRSYHTTHAQVGMRRQSSLPSEGKGGRVERRIKICSGSSGDLPISSIECRRSG